MRLFDRLKIKKTSSRRRKKPINPIALGVIAFIVAAVTFNYHSYKNLTPSLEYYEESFNASFPIIYQMRNEKN